MFLGKILISDAYKQYFPEALGFFESLKTLFKPILKHFVVFFPLPFLRAVTIELNISRQRTLKHWNSTSEEMSHYML